MSTPMLLTLLRILLIPIIVVFFYIPFSWAHTLAAGIFAVAGVTDWLDGYLARKWGQSSQFGAFLDPVADKLMVIIALVLLVSNAGFPFITLPAIVIITREIIVSALREWMAELGKRASVAVSYVSKIKTTLQIMAIILLLAAHPVKPDWIMYLGYILLYAAAILTLWTMMVYLKIAWPDLKFK